MATGSDLSATGVPLRGHPHQSGKVTAWAPGPASGIDPDPSQWPVLVTGAGGFVGGHVARHLASAGHSVRGLARRPVDALSGDASIEWVIGDLTDAGLRRRALEGVRGVIHTAGWVSLGPDVKEISQAVNVDLTRALLAEAKAAGVERFIYTSTLYTLAAGTPQRLADESSEWNLQRIDSSYVRTKRQAERMVLEASGDQFTTIALCPGMVIGPRDSKPTSTQIIRAYSKTTVGIAPGGGIPIVDSRLLALAHRRALIAGGGGQRYAVIGPYLSYSELARLVNEITGRPRLIVPLPGLLEPLIVRAAGWFGPLVRRWYPDVSPQLAAAGFLGLHISGKRANACLGLEHPTAHETIASCLSQIN